VAKRRMASVPRRLVERLRPFFVEVAVLIRRTGRIALLAAVLLVAATALMAQSNVKVEGEVLDARSRAPLIGANVMVQGTNYGAATDEGGRFALRDLPPGRYRLEVRMLGYRTESRQVEVEVDVTAWVRFMLEPQPIRMPEVVVTAERRSASNPAAAVTVITREEIERRQAKTLAEVLQDAVGVQVLATGGLGRPARVSIRGSAPNQVLVLLDGQKLNTAQSGSVDLSTIPIDWVDRIEVVRGGSSAMRGGEAIGGIINIVTRRARPASAASFQLAGSVGAFGTMSVTPSFSMSLGPVGVRMSFQRLETQGDFRYSTFADPPKNSIAVTRVRDNADATSDNAFVKLSWSGPAGIAAELSTQVYNARMGIPGPETQLTPEARQTDRRTLMGASLRLPLGKRLLGELLAYSHRFVQEYQAPPPGVYVFHNRHRNRAVGVEARLHSRLGGIPATFGYAFRRDLLRSDDLIRPSRSLGRLQRTTHSLFLQAEMELLRARRRALRLKVVPGYRVDRPSDQGTAYSPKLGVVLGAGEASSITIRGNIGKSYRAPTLNSLFWVADAFALGNPNLRPERATNFDVGAALRLPLAGELTAEVAWFGSDVKDIVVWQRQFDGRFRPFNVARAQIRGREDHLRWRLGHGWVVAELNHTYLNAINRSGERVTDGKQLVFRPRHTTAAALSVQLGRFYLEARRRWVSKRFIREANTKFLDPYSITDARAAVTRTSGSWTLKIGIEIDNLTNESYRLIEGYPMPGREWRLNLEVGR